jgi:hypothetical protein
VRALLAVDQTCLVQQREHPAYHHGVSVKLACHIVGGLQYIRFGGQQGQGVNACCESGIDGHAPTYHSFAGENTWSFVTIDLTCKSASPRQPLYNFLFPEEPSLRILFVGDVFGSAGRRIVREHIGHIISGRQIDLVIVNAENAAGGFGLTPAIATEMFDLGAHVLTTGNHVWDKKEIIDYLKSVPADSHDRPRRVIRPANYAPGTPGYGFYEGALPSGQTYAVISLQGRVFMANNEDPFRVVDALLNKITAKVIVVDIHAEATSEKAAMGWYLDGRVTAVIGTHTHVPTADNRVLTNGTAYQTDVGMSGPYDSIIGVEKQLVLDRFLTGMPGKFEAAKGDPRMAALIIECDGATGRATATERLLLGE